MYSNLENCYLWQIAEFLSSQGFSNYIEKVMSSGESNDNVLDKLIDAIWRGESPMSVFPSSHSDLMIITIPDPTDGVSGTLSNVIHK